MKSQIHRVTLSSTCSSRDFSLGGGCCFGGDGSGSCGNDSGDGGVGVSDVTTTSSFISSGEVLIFTGGGD